MRGCTNNLAEPFLTVSRASPQLTNCKALLGRMLSRLLLTTKNRISLAHSPRAPRSRRAPLLGL